MGDKSRFHHFARTIAEHFTPDNDIADVAGGRGYLQVALRDHGFRRVTTWDKRNARACRSLEYRYQWFDATRAPNQYSLVVGMHPDEGTDHIIAYAGRHRVPFVVCPCCVKPSAHAYWQGAKFSLWIDHLLGLAERLNLDVQTVAMPIQGRNLVLIGRPTAT